MVVPSEHSTDNDEHTENDKEKPTNKVVPSEHSSDNEGHTDNDKAETSDTNHPPNTSKHHSADGLSNILDHYSEDGDFEMATSLGLDRIPKLDGKNFNNWRKKIQMVLTLQDLWDIMHEKELDHDNPRFHTWKKAQDHALAFIHLSCDDDQCPLIADCTTGIQAMERLSATFASSALANVMRLEELFGRAKKAPTQTMSQWINHIKSLAA